MIPTPAPYPSPTTPAEAAERARGSATILKGQHQGALVSALGAFDEGLYMEAIEHLQPMMRYNPGTAGAQACAALFLHWQHALPINGLEPLVEEWWDFAQRLPEYVDDTPPPRVRTCAHIKALVNEYSSIMEGTAENAAPLPIWRRIMFRLGASGYRILPPKLWDAVTTITHHIAKVRLRNPNVAPRWCMGLGTQAGLREGDQDWTGWQTKSG